LGFICYHPIHGVGGLRHPVYSTFLHEAVRQSRKRGRPGELQVSGEPRYASPN
jgi:hypothetical protein